MSEDNQESLQEIATEQEVATIQKELENAQENSDINGCSETCALCKHPARDQLTEVYYDNNKNIETARTWFFNKFKRSFSDKSWEKHFKEHVEPFVQSFALSRQKKLNELVEKSSNLKKDPQFSPVAVIKQILLEFMIDGYTNKPEQLVSKEDIFKWSNFAKIEATLAKTYQGWQQMEMEMLGSGKTEDELKEVMTNYMKKTVKDLIETFGDKPEVQQRIADMYGISVAQGKGGTGITDVSIR